MQSAIFDTPVLKSESLKTKFDTCVISNSFVALIGDYIEARIVQQLHYWSYSEYGVVIKDLRWIYKPIREWLSEAFVGFTSWQLRKAIASLVAKGILLKEHLFKEHHGNNFSPKNRTYYYSVNYQRLEKLFQERETAQLLSEQSPAKQDAGATRRSTKNVRFVSSTKQVCESPEKQFCDSTKNKTKNTSIENNSKYISHPHLPCESERKKTNNQEKRANLSASEPLEILEVDSANPKVIDKEANVGNVEKNINQNICTDINSAQIETDKLQNNLKASPKLKVNKTKQKRENKAPWQDEAEKSQFYRALIQALPIVANSHSPQGLAKTIIAQLKRGEEHTYWDDFAADLPIGTSTKPEWEVEPGVPYPMFIEYLTEKIIRGNNTQTQEQARNEVFRILDKPRQAIAFWSQFKRSVVNISEQVERDRALGVSNPNTPVWTRERIEPSIEDAAAAGQKITAVNDATQAVIESARTPQLESKDSFSVPQSLNSATSTSLNKSEEVSSSSDPWNEDGKPENSEPEADKPTLSMREMLAARGVKGFCPKGYRSAYKPMPKVSQAEAEAEAKAALKDTASHKSEATKRQQMNYKTHLNQMSLDEINELLKDPISRAELTPQLFHSDYELITDYLGQIIGVKLSNLQKREMRSHPAEGE